MSINFMHMGHKKEWQIYESRKDNLAYFYMNISNGYLIAINRVKEDSKFVNNTFEVFIGKNHFGKIVKTHEPIRFVVYARYDLDHAKGVCFAELLKYTIKHGYNLEEEYPKEFVNNLWRLSEEGLTSNYKREEKSNYMWYNTFVKPFEYSEHRVYMCCNLGSKLKVIFISTPCSSNYTTMIKNRSDGKILGIMSLSSKCFNDAIDLAKFLWIKWADERKTLLGEESYNAIIKIKDVIL